LAGAPLGRGAAWPGRRSRCRGGGGRGGGCGGGGRGGGGCGGWVRADVDAAVRDALTNRLGRGQGLDGDLGAAETALVAGQVLDREDWLEAARRIGTMVAADMLAHDGVVGAGWDRASTCRTC
jgi:hypothetical protein